jgi:hypothetical protein
MQTFNWTCQHIPQFFKKMANNNRDFTHFCVQFELTCWIFIKAKNIMTTTVQKNTQIVQSLVPVHLTVSEVTDRKETHRNCVCVCVCVCVIIWYKQWHTEGGFRGVWNPPHKKKLQSFDIAELNSHFCGIYMDNNLTRIRVSLNC